MFRKVKNNAGFTLLELVLIIIILGILAISTMPKFMNLKQESLNLERTAVISAVKSGIDLYRAKKISENAFVVGYPLKLDEEIRGKCQNCFSLVLNVPLEDSSWTKIDESLYKYDDGKVVKTYTYDSLTGDFEQN